jgi:hypothetical protein
MEFQARDNSACPGELSLNTQSAPSIITLLLQPYNGRVISLVVMFAHDAHCQMARLHLLLRSRAILAGGVQKQLRWPWVYWETGGETRHMDDGDPDGCPPVFCIRYSRALFGRGVP